MAVVFAIPAGRLKHVHIFSCECECARRRASGVSSCLFRWTAAGRDAAAAAARPHGHLVPSAEWRERKQKGRKDHARVVRVCMRCCSLRVGRNGCRTVTAERNGQGGAASAGRSINRLRMDQCSAHGECGYWSLYMCALCVARLSACSPLDRLSVDLASLFALQFVSPLFPRCVAALLSAALLSPASRSVGLRWQSLHGAALLSSLRCCCCSILIVVTRSSLGQLAALRMRPAARLPLVVCFAARRGRPIQTTDR